MATLRFQRSFDAAGCTNPLAKATTTNHARRAIMNISMHPSQDTSPFCSEVEFAKYEKDTGLLDAKYCGAPSSNVPQWLTPVAIFTLAVAVVISSMPPAVVQYLVFVIMFSAPAVGVIAFFAQSVAASDYCSFDWTPVAQTSKRFVVRGGDIPFEVAESFPILHLVLLVTTLAGLAVMWRLGDHFIWICPLQWSHRRPAQLAIQSRLRHRRSQLPRPETGWRKR
jgi:hypothetical protein